MLTQDPLEIKNKEVSQRQPQPVTTAADLILHYLEQIGVEYVFGIPGGAIEPLYNALARSERRGGPRAVVARHETGAAFMADGYARETGKLGVCCATTGPGATNMITGVASAYMDQVPLLAITAQTATSTFGRGAFQESSCKGVDTVAIYQSCTRYNSLVSHVDQLERKLIDAIITAKRPPYGPAHLSLPVDVLRAKVRPISIDINSLLCRSRGFDEHGVDQAYRSLCSARNIVFLVGAGARSAIAHILELAILLNGYIVTTPHSKGLVNSYHPQYRGVYGISGHASAHALVNSSSIDIIVAVGINFDEITTHAWEASPLFGPNVICIDEYSHYFPRAPSARLHITSNIDLFLERLLERFKSLRAINGGERELRTSSRDYLEAPVIPFDRRVESRRRATDASPAPSFQGVSFFPKSDRRNGPDRRTNGGQPAANRRFRLAQEEKFSSASSPIKPQRLMYDLSRLSPPNTRFLADIGNSMYWAIHYLHPFNRRVLGARSGTSEYVRIGMGFGSMGWAIGAAIGTAMAARHEPVICITGDGSMLMSSHELTTAREERLGIIFIVLNDSSLGAVRHGQQLNLAEAIGYRLPTVNFVEYAKAIGIESYPIRSPHDLSQIDLKRLFAGATPALLDVYVDPDETPPLRSV